MPFTEKYTKTAIVLHWSVAMAMIANVVLAWCFPYVGDDRIRLAIDSHKSLGITVLGLALLRLLWRFAHKPPAFPLTRAKWEARAATAAHVLLYALIIALPLSGWLHDSAWKDANTHPMYWFGLFHWPRVSLISDIEPVFKEQLHTLFGLIHHYLAYFLYALFVLHVMAALKHHFSATQRVRGRGMLPG